MTAMIARTLLSGLDDWLQKVESTDAGKRQNQSGESAMNDIAVGALFTQISLIVQILKTNPECWKEVAEFVKQQSGRCKSPSARGCLNVLEVIGGLFVQNA